MTVTENLGEKLKQQTAAVRFQHWKLGTSKTLTPEQRAEAAKPFGADQKSLSASKRLLDTSHSKYKAVLAGIRRAKSHWQNLTVWYPIKGIRLIRRDRIDSFDQEMGEFQADLNASVEALGEAYEELREAAQQRLGDLFNGLDYPDKITGLFGFKWDYPNVEPPNYLKELNPELYEIERQRVAARFDEAFAEAEQAFAAELNALVQTLLEKLAGEDGKKKSIRKDAVGGISRFLADVRNLPLSSSSEFEALIDIAEKAIGGVDVEDLRKDQGLREHVSADLHKVQELLDGVLVDKSDRVFRLDGDDA